MQRLLIVLVSLFVLILIAGTSSLSQIATGGSGAGGIPVSVTGTVESPQVRPNVGKMVKNVGEELLGSFFKKNPK